MTDLTRQAELYICHPVWCATNYTDAPGYFADCSAMREICNCGAIEFYDLVVAQAELIATLKSEINGLRLDEES